MQKKHMVHFLGNPTLFDPEFVILLRAVHKLTFSFKRKPLFSTIYNPNSFYFI